MSGRDDVDPELYRRCLENPEEFLERLRPRDEGPKTPMPRRRLGRKQQVGYGNPPIETRWKPGQSGNPAGRRKGSKDIRAAISAILTDKITLREGDKVRSVTRLEAVMLKQMQKALNGDSRAIQAVYAAANALGLLQPRPQQLVLGELGAFTKEELIEFERLLLKASARVIPK